MVSRSWKQLTDQEREPWDELSRKDKARFQFEKSMYDGPWKVPDVKDPHAPKRPVSAFLLFSKAKRDIVKRDGRHRTTTEISTVLSKMWKEASVEERNVYIERDLEDRQRYKRELYEYQLVASEGRHEREVLAAQAVADEEDDNLSRMSQRLRRQQHNGTMEKKGKNDDEEELSQLVADPSNCNKSVPSKMEYRSEPASPGVDFAAEWAQNTAVAASPPHPSSGGDDCSYPPLGTESSVGRGSRECRSEHHSGVQHCQTEPLGSELLTNFTKTMDDMENAGTTARQLLLDPRSEAAMPMVHHHQQQQQQMMNWDPIPLDAPVAEFDLLSNSDGDDDDFEVSPITTRSTMDDGSYNASVITPPQRSVAPALFMDTTTKHYRRAAPLGYYPPTFHQQQQQQSWRDNRQYYNPAFMYRGGYKTAPAVHRNEAPTTTAVPSSSLSSSLSSYDAHHHWYHNHNAAYHPVTSSTEHSTTNIRSHRTPSGDDNDRNGKQRDNNNTGRPPSSLDSYLFESIYPI
jgi:HMG (high mobility group) box